MNKILLHQSRILVFRKSTFLSLLFFMLLQIVAFTKPSGDFINTDTADLEVYYEFDAVQVTESSNDAPLLGTVSYKLLVVNNGPAEATNVVVQTNYRSFDGQNFEPIEKVEREGYGGDYVYYQTEDQQAKFGENFYRIKQYNLDGTITLSNVRSVAYALDENSISLYPNPVHYHLNVDVRKLAGQSAVIQIQDIYGRLVMKKRIEQLPDYPIELDLKGFKNGLYFLNLKVEKLRLVTRKFVVEQ